MITQTYALCEDTHMANGLSNKYLSVGTTTWFSVCYYNRTRENDSHTLVRDRKNSTYSIRYIGTYSQVLLYETRWTI